MTTASIYDDRICALGEGALWHPERRQFFWFDIMAKRLLSQSETGAPLFWQFNEHVSAAGWIDNNKLLVASETALCIFDLDTEKSQKLCDLEADNSTTRSNDGRADPWGGFWIGTMGKVAEKDAGAIYRYYQGELRSLVSPITIPNAICFAPDGRFVYFTDTAQGIIWQQPLHKLDGWPAGDATVFVDCTKESVFPDGAVTDREGNLWNAQWGSSRIACYNASGEFQKAIHFPAEQISCPAFGGPELTTLFATSATENLSQSALKQQADAGKTFHAENVGVGRAEHQIRL
jgi:sugar lactone lactonase YvrE